MSRLPAAVLVMAVAFGISAFGFVRLEVMPGPIVLGGAEKLGWLKALKESARISR